MNTPTSASTSRSGLYERLVRRRGDPLSAARASARLSAYVYGNILTLAAVVATDQHATETGTAALVVVGTAVTTFLAHVFAEYVAHSNIPEATAQHSDDERETMARNEFRDAMPIASSGSVPAVILALGWLDVLPAWWAELAAGGVVVVRIAIVPGVTERIRGNPPSFTVFLGGLATAAGAAVIVVLKIVIGH